MGEAAKAVTRVSREKAPRDGTARGKVSPDVTAREQAPYDRSRIGRMAPPLSGEGESSEA